MIYRQLTTCPTRLATSLTRSSRVVRVYAYRIGARALYCHRARLNSLRKCCCAIERSRLVVLAWCAVWARGARESTQACALRTQMLFGGCVCEQARLTHITNSALDVL